VIVEIGQKGTSRQRLRKLLTLQQTAWRRPESPSMMVASPGSANCPFCQSANTFSTQEVCERDLEGVICKRKDSVYSSRARWLKVKNPDYTQAIGRKEMFEKFR
jgi:ATP-dependent DNA ligase